MFELERISSADFSAFALAHPLGNWLQTVEMATFREKRGWDVHFVGIRRDGTLTGAALVAGKQGRYEVTMGPLLDYNDDALVQAFLRRLADYVKQIGGYRVEVYPQVVRQLHDGSGKPVGSPDESVMKLIEQAGYVHKGLTREYDMVANRWVFVKDLSGLSNEEDLLMSYRQTTRQIVKKLETARYSIKALGYDELDVLKSLVDSSNEKNGVPARELAYYQQLYEAMGPKAQFLVVLYDEKTPLAGAVFIMHPNEVVYFMSGTDSEHRHLYGGQYLQHYMMLQMIQRSEKRYNFYGISGHFEHNSLLTYKAGFRGGIEEYVGGFYQVVDPARQRRMQIRDKIKRTIRRVAS